MLHTVYLSLFGSKILCLSSSLALIPCSSLLLFLFFSIYSIDTARFPPIILSVFPFPFKSEWNFHNCDRRLWVLVSISVDVCAGTAILHWASYWLLLHRSRSVSSYVFTFICAYTHRSFCSPFIFISFYSIWFLAYLCGVCAWTLRIRLELPVWLFMIKWIVTVTMAACQCVCVWVWLCVCNECVCSVFVWYSDI